MLLPGLTPAEAAGICRRVIETLAELGRAAGAQDIAVTLSGGLTALGASSAETLKAAELAVTLARAKGGDRLDVQAVAGTDPIRHRPT